MNNSVIEDEIIVIESTPLSIQGDLLGLKTRYETLVAATQQVLQKDIDFGTIPGTGSKPVLLKPGAEKLATLFHLRAAFTLQDSMENWDAGRFYYRYRCTLYAAGEPVGDGEGSCNTLEKKYRWRNQQRTCPVCGQATIIKGHQKYGGGWLCWKKRDGCGAKFKDGDRKIEGQATGQIENPEPYDLINTVQKMAQKRALVAAVLVVTGASAFFTQDLEDSETKEKSPISNPKPKKAVLRNDLIGLTEIQRAAFRYKTPKGVRLGECSSERLCDMQAWVDENPDVKGASELGNNIVVALDYLNQIEEKKTAVTDTRTPEEVLDENRALLHGDEEDEI